FRFFGKGRRGAAERKSRFRDIGWNPRFQSKSPPIVRNRRVRAAGTYEMLPCYPMREETTMVLTTIVAQLSCSELERRTEWLATIFDRNPDARPLQGLAGCRHGPSAGCQRYRSPTDAGHGTLTLIVGDERAEHARFSFDRFRPGKIESADYMLSLRV